MDAHQSNSEDGARVPTATSALQIEIKGNEGLHRPDSLTTARTADGKLVFATDPAEAANRIPKQIDWTSPKTNRVGDPEIAS